VSYTYSGVPRDPVPWTPLLADLRERCGRTAGVSFNGMLANLYRDGADSMGWHSDDEPALGPEPVIASVSLGAERRFDFRHRSSGERVSVLLPHGSLLVMSGASQSRWMHRIARSVRVPSARINLTFRRLL
jgi:alkylated DNA repair dioxygenase AlkB